MEHSFFNYQIIQTGFLNSHKFLTLTTLKYFGVKHEHKRVFQLKSIINVLVHCVESISEQQGPTVFLRVLKFVFHSMYFMLNNAS